MKRTDPKPEEAVKQVTFSIQINPDGPSDADFQIAAERYAENRFRETVKDSWLRRFLAVFGLYNEPNEKAHKNHFQA